MRIAWVVVAVLLLLGTVSTVQGVRNALGPGGSQDYQWKPSQMLLEGKNPYFLYQEYVDGRLQTFPFPLSQVPNYPASGLMLLWPITFMDLDSSKVIWSAINVLCAIGTVLLLGRLFAVPSLLCLGLLALFLMSTPVRNTIGNGQHGLYSLFFFVLAFFLQRRNAPRMAAVCLALSWLKFTITWPLSLIFLAPTYRRTLLAAVGIHLLLTLFLSFWTNTNPLALLTGPLAVSETGTVIRMFDFIAIFHYWGVSTRAPAFLFGAMLFCFAVVVIRTTEKDTLAQLSWLSLVSAVWTHHSALDHFFLVVPLLYAVMKWRTGIAQAADRLQIGLTLYSVCVIWFGMRFLDAAQLRLPGDPLIAVTQQVAFWTVAIAVYTLLVYSAVQLISDRGVPPIRRLAK